MKVRRTLERHYRDVMDIEFTIQQGVLYMLQCRVGKRTATAAVRCAIDMVKEKRITPKQALLRVEPERLNELLRPVFDPAQKVQAVQNGRLLTKGLNAGPGAATGRIAFHADDAEAMAAEGHRVILVRIETSPEDIRGMAAADGILTARGGMTSHAALVGRQMGKVCVVGCEALQIDYAKREVRIDGSSKVLRERDPISIDGFSGDPRFSTMTLGPFSPSEHRKFIETIVGSSELATGLAERLYEATDANPFFTRELVRSLIDSGGIARADSGHWALSGEMAIASDALPATIQQTVERRIERLSEELREILSIASVIGRKPERNAVLLDAGALALSKDRSTQAAPRDYGFGLMLDRAGRRAFGDAIVIRTHQEHGEVRGESGPLPFERLPVGARVRVAPNHACLTAAAYDRYHVVDGGEAVVAVWGRVNGW